MVSLYDKSFVQLIKSWTENTDIHVYGKDETQALFSLIADKNNDKEIQLPIITIRRPGGYDLRTVHSAPPTRDGYKVFVDDNVGVTANAIPIKIVYQIDVYTRYFEEADAYCRDLIFNIVNHPISYVTIPYNNLDLKHNYKMTLGAQITDNSDVVEGIIAGMFTRMTLEVEIEDAYLWSVPVRQNITMDGDGIYLTPIMRADNTVEENEKINI